MRNNREKRISSPEPAPIPASDGPRLRRNVIANYLGSGWSAAVSLVFVPMYIKYLGAEAYGLVGFFVTVQAVMVLLDMGLSAIANRETARRSAGDDVIGMRDLLRTLEVVFWAVAAAIAVTMFAMSEFVATHWLQRSELPAATVAQSVSLIGVAIAAQWPASLYTGALLGLQRHVVLNALVAGFTTLRAAGALLVLILVSPSITVFFAWFIALTLVQTVAMRIALWRLLPDPRQKERFRWSLLREQARFAVGITGAYALTLVITQLDKVILSRLLTLEGFGYYALAAVVAMSLYRLVGPVTQAVYPRLAQLTVHPHLHRELSGLYQRSSQAIAALTIPVAVVVALFSRELLLLWTGDSVVAAETYRLLTILIVGMAFYGLAALPYMLQLAHGWTRLAFLSNAFAVAVLVPGMIVGVRLCGAEGAAGTWLATSAMYLAIHVYFTHRRLLPGEMGRWLRQDFAAPLAASLTVAGTARLLLPAHWSGAIMLAALLLTGMVTVAAASAVMPWMRTYGEAAIATAFRS